ncbi:MAG: hypothetical protein VX938_04445, partial [Myxococcota bacterium]|nr:hypothetical protein [Myxococcota bacterium]
VGVVHAGRFDTLVEERVIRGLGGEMVQRPGEHLERVATLPESRSGGALAWGTTHNQVGLLVWAPTADIAAERWWTLSSGTSGYISRDDIKAIRSQVPSGALMWAVVEGSPTLPPQLGPMGAAVSSMLQGLSLWSGALVAEEHGLSIRVLGQWMGKGGLPADWLHGQPLSSTITRRLPQSTTAFGRLRLNPARLRLIPSWLRDRFLPPRVPGPLGEVLPSTSVLLGHLGDEIGVGLLGLDESATLETLSSGMHDPRRLTQLLHVAVAARLSSPDAGVSLIQELRTTLQNKGWTTADVSAGGWSGLSVRGTHPPQIWNILTAGDVLLVASGAGEVERLRALAEGRALPLMGDQDAASQNQVAHVRLGFTRLTRELADKGVPPYFLEMLNDLRQLDLWVDLASDHLALRLELQL